MPIFRPSTPTPDDFWFAPALACAAPLSPAGEGAGPLPHVRAPPSGPRRRSPSPAGRDRARPVGTLAATKRRGGGSWLLGSLALLDADAARRDAPPPGLAGLSDEESSAASSRDDAASFSDGRRTVTFAPTVAVRAIPPASELSPAQRRRMYATTAEIRREGARNRKEFRYDGWDWRAATEEEDMWQVDLVTGEAVHPAHYDCD